MAYTFELFEDATFSDGHPVTAEDVVFSLKLLFNYNVQESTPHRASFATLADAQIDPSNKRKFTLLTNDKHIHGEDALAGVNVYPRHIFDPNGLLDKYTLADLIANGETLAANEDLKAHADMYLSAPFSRDPAKLIGATLMCCANGKMASISPWHAIKIGGPISMSKLIPTSLPALTA
ncbi:MAG: ABC transporter substrate-binding protein [Saprospiraceae bacterium]